MSDFDVQEAIPERVRTAMEKHPILKKKFQANNFMGKFLYYEANTYENGDPWHLVIVETNEGIIQFGVEEFQKDKQTDLLYFQPISISEIKLYCRLSQTFKQQILYLADTIKDEEDLHDHHYGDHIHHHSLK